MRFTIGLVSVAWRNKPLMKTKMLFATLQTLVLVTAGYAQTLDKAKLDQLFDRLLEKNKGMGSLTLAKDGAVLYTRSFGYSQINGTEKKPLTAETKFFQDLIAKADQQTAEAKNSKDKKKDDAANAIDRPNTIWMSLRKPPDESPNASVSPVTTMMMTAIIFATGPSTDCRI